MNRNSRIVRNPPYENCKASIRESGLDAPPAITRRPGEPYCIIRNGGNTRSSILRELWSESRDEKFFRQQVRQKSRWPVKTVVDAES